MNDNDTALVEISKAEQALNRAGSIHEMLILRDQAAAFKLLADAQGYKEAAQKAKIFQLKAERKAGDWLAENLDHRGNQFGTAYQDGRPLPDGITWNESSRWQLEAKVPEEHFNTWVDHCVKTGKEITSSQLQTIGRKFSNNPNLAWYQSSESDDWSTPQWLFDMLNKEINFEIDVCANEENHKCNKYFTKAQDAFSQEWKGSCWMNPPYGHSVGGGISIYQWIEKAYLSAKQGALVACLVPARTDTLWWWNYCIHGEVRFLKGRIHFSNSDNSATFPSAVIIFWPKVPNNRAKVVWWNTGN